MERYYEKALQLVEDYVRSQMGSESPYWKFETTISWFSKTLQNWKAIVITDLPDDLMYEVTYDGDKKFTYIDVYRKLGNTRIPDEDIQPSPPKPVTPPTTVTYSTGPKYNIAGINIDSDDPRRNIQIGDGGQQINTYYR